MRGRIERSKVRGQSSYLDRVEFARHAQRATAHAFHTTVQTDRPTAARRTADAAVHLTRGALGARRECVRPTSSAICRRDGGGRAQRRATEVLAQRQVVERALVDVTANEARVTSLQWLNYLQRVL